MKLNKIVIIWFMLIGVIFADQLSTITANKVLKAGVKADFEPFGFLDSNNQLVGFDVDIAKFIAKELGVEIELIPVTSANRIEMLLNNNIDIIAASMTHKKTRDKDIDFSISYYFDGQGILAKSSSTASNYNDFQGKKIATLAGSVSGKVFEAISPLAKISYYDTADLLLAAFEKGEIDAITSDSTFLSEKAKKSNGKYKMIGKPFTIEPYAVGMRENESNFRDEINFAIQKMVKTGYYDEIYLKWLGQKPSVRPELWP